jgi:hypothetical protein
MTSNEKYINDPFFHKYVDTVISILKQGKLSKEFLYEATVYAIDKYIDLKTGEQDE